MRGRRPRRKCQFASDPSHQPRSSATCTAPSSRIRREREGSIPRRRATGEIQRGQGESCPSPPPHAAHRLLNRLKTSPVPATTPRFATNATSPRTLSFIASFVKSSHPSSHGCNRRGRRSLASSPRPPRVETQSIQDLPEPAPKGSLTVTISTVSTGSGAMEQNIRPDPQNFGNDVTSVLRQIAHP